MERIFSIKIKKESSSDSTAKVIPISSSECNGSFQELTGRQSNRSNQILTVTDNASLRGRSLYHKWKHIFGPRLIFTSKNMIKTDVSEGS